MRLCGFGFSGTDRLFGGFRLISGRPTTLHPYIILLLYLTYKELKLGVGGLHLCFPLYLTYKELKRTEGGTSRRRLGTIVPYL